MHRRPVNKHRAAKAFRHSVGRTKALNMSPGVMRGGFRL